MRTVGSRPRSLESLTAALSLAIIAVLSAVGGYARRWMSDDGLIVLRTVRNLQAGYGPVFNAGERVEANTSTLWQYLIYLGSWSGLRLETVAVGLGLLLSTAAMVLGADSARKLWRLAATAHRNPGADPLMILPVGAVIYLALPPARDFFTSGLEWGLAIFWLALTLWLLVQWLRRYQPDSVGRYGLLLAWWLGMSWLVRPELALYGGVLGLLLVVAQRRGRDRLAIMAVALPLPAGYQIFRMGYYGLLTPHTAVAKSANDALWRQGIAYVADFVVPYQLWLPLGLVVLLLAAGAGQRWYHWRAHGHSSGSLAGALAGVKVPLLALALWYGCAVVHSVYIIRVGGDFMHGRMLLLPLFAGLLPVFVLPLSQWWQQLISAGVACWAVVMAAFSPAVDWETFDTDQAHGIVDERSFWRHAAGLSDRSPIYIEDFQQVPWMHNFSEEALPALTAGAAYAYPVIRDEQLHWDSVAPEPGRQDPPTVYLLTLGMPAALAPLEVRVLDPMGLATPLAARGPRLPDGRIGHDKDLAAIWRVADSAAQLDQLPQWQQPEEAQRARLALAHPDFQELFASYRQPLDWQRFRANLVFALSTGRSLQLSDDPEDYLGEVFPR